MWIRQCDYWNAGTVSSCKSNISIYNGVKVIEKFDDFTLILLHQIVMDMNELISWMQSDFGSLVLIWFQLRPTPDQSLHKSA